MKQLSKDAVNWVEIGENAAGQRIDNFLLTLLKGVPKSHIYRILRSGEVRVNSKRVEASDRLVIGDRLRVPPVRTADPALAPPAPWVQPAEFPILFEDDALLAIDKPAGVAVHGGSGVSFGVIEQLRQARPGQSFLELVHRLDRDTSGVLLLAKKRAALVAMHALMRDGHTDKRYLALVRGRWPHLRREVRVSLHKYVTAGGERRVRADADGQDAITIFTRKQVWPEATLLEARLKTGRTHQIRVHLAHAEYPIAGDDKYGDFEWNKVLARQGLKRMFLHAARLGFTHPGTGAALQLEARLPPELAAHVARLDQGQAAA
ncbi:MAG: RluA family pseudouridine synthase [Betaproteobacteria bacterium]|nr:RluA family pseudouridine synthase [Betaproteobacteria bacterium]